MRSLFSFYCCCMLLSGMVMQASAQTAIWNNYRQKLFSGLSGPSVTYRYRMNVYNGRDNRKKEVLDGIMLYNGKDYLDSNTARLTLSQNNMFLELDFEARRAVVSAYKKLGFRQRPADPAGSTFKLSDSVISRYGKIQVDTNAVRGIAVITIDMRAAELLLKEVRLYVNRQDMTLSKLYYTYENYVDDLDETPDDTRYECMIYDIGRPIPGRAINIDAYVKHSRKSGFGLLAPYGAYKLKQVN